MTQEFLTILNLALGTLIELNFILKLLFPGFIAFEFFLGLLFFPKIYTYLSLREIQTDMNTEGFFESLFADLLVSVVEGIAIGLMAGIFTGKILHSIYFMTSNLIIYNLMLSLCAHLVHCFTQEQMKPPAVNSTNNDANDDESNDLLRRSSGVQNDLSISPSNSYSDSYLAYLEASEAYRKTASLASESPALTIRLVEP